MNQQPTIWHETADFRMYLPEIWVDEQGIEVTQMLCEDKVGSRWEPFYSNPSLREAREILAAHGR